MPTTDTPVQNLIINTMTQAQYATITPSETELYMVTDGVISSSDVITALGYTPYNSSNPSGYQANVLETVKVNGTALTATSKTVDITLPAALTVDTALSSTSENPVQNKVIYTALSNKVNISGYVAYTAGEVQALWSSI